MASVQTIISFFAQALFWLLTICAFVRGRLLGLEADALLLSLGGGIALTFVGAIWIFRLSLSQRKFQWANPLIFVVFLLVSLAFDPNPFVEFHPVSTAVSLGLALFFLSLGGTRFEENTFPRISAKLGAPVAAVAVWLAFSHGGMDSLLQWRMFFWAFCLLLAFELALATRRESRINHPPALPSLPPLRHARLLALGVISSAWPMLAWLALRPVADSSLAGFVLVFTAWTAGAALGGVSRGWVFGSEAFRETCARPLAFWSAASPLFFTALLAFSIRPDSPQTLLGVPLETLATAATLLLMGYGGLFASLVWSLYEKADADDLPKNGVALFRLQRLGVLALGVALGFSLATAFAHTLLAGFLLVAGLAALLPIHGPWKVSKLLDSAAHLALIVISASHAVLAVDMSPSWKKGVQRLPPEEYSFQERTAACLPFVLTRSVRRSMLSASTDSDALPAAVACSEGLLSLLPRTNPTGSQNIKTTLEGISALASEKQKSLQWLASMAAWKQADEAEPYDMAVLFPRTHPGSTADFRLSSLVSSHPPGKWTGLAWLWLPLENLSAPFFFEVVDYACETFDRKVALVWVGDDPAAPLIALVGGNLERLRETIQIPEEMREAANLGLRTTDVIPFEKDARVTGLTSLCESRKKSSTTDDETGFLLQLERLASSPSESPANAPTLLMWLLSLADGYRHTNDTAQHAWEATRAYLEGRIHHTAGRRLQAVERFAASLALKPQDNPALDALKDAGKSAKLRKSYKEARQFFQKILDAKAEDFETLMEAANLAYWEYDTSACIVLYRKALEITPNSPQALKGLGLALYQAKKEEEAIETLIQAATLNPYYGSKSLELIAREMEKNERSNDAESLRERIRGLGF